MRSLSPTTVGVGYKLDGERWLVFHRTVYSLRRQCLAGAFTTRKERLGTAPAYATPHCAAGAEEICALFMIHSNYTTPCQIRSK